MKTPLWKWLAIALSAATDAIVVMVVLGLVGIPWPVAFAGGVAAAFVSLLVMSRVLRVPLGWWGLS